MRAQINPLAQLSSIGGAAIKCDSAHRAICECARVAYVISFTLVGAKVRRVDTSLIGFTKTVVVADSVVHDLDRIEKIGVRSCGLIGDGDVAVNSARASRAIDPSIVGR